MRTKKKLTPGAARAVARVAYVFLYPLIVNYATAFEMTSDRTSNKARGRWRRSCATAARLHGCHDPAVSQAWCKWLDLGRGSLLWSSPADGWVLRTTRWLDLWGFTPEIRGVEEPRRAIGARFLISTNDNDVTIPGIDAVVRSETKLVRVCCTQDPRSSRSRPQRFDVSEEPMATPVSALLGLNDPLPSPTFGFKWRDAVLTGPGFWDCAAFALSLTRPHPEDLPILDLLEQIGVVAGTPRRIGVFDDSVKSAIDVGMSQAIEELALAVGSARAPGLPPTRRQEDRDYFARAVRTLAHPHCAYPPRPQRGLG